ncbi:MAG: hypothetical protein ABIG61_17220 [Planctomycetota bacterium]
MNCPLADAPDIAPIVFIVVAIFALSVALICLAIKVLITCRLFAKAGYNWLWGLLVLVPFGTLVLPLFLAFAKWPIEKELQQLRGQIKTAGGS